MAVPMNILFVDDEEKIRTLMQRELSRMGYAICCAGTGKEALNRIQEEEYDLVLLDLKLPDMDGIRILKEIKEIDPLVEVIVLTGHGTINTAVEAMKLGAYDYLTKPCKLAEMEVVLEKAYEKRCINRENLALKRMVTNHAFPQIAGRSPAMQKILTLVEKVAPTDSTILIQGESGTGKELVVQALHQRSRRSSLPLIAVNCAALQESLLESELFGHERGAFTGAFQQKPGLFELAHQGTLFLDEIGEMSPSLQVKLLRVLQSGEIRRVGGSRIFKVNVRTIAATNKDLKRETDEGRFREDLYFRLNVIMIQLPPLRDRKEDISLLVFYLLEK
ncbi:MAG: sigma-54 dependent transcriptional regulator, partial [Bacteroidota bacterium]